MPPKRIKIAQLEHTGYKSIGKRDGKNGHVPGRAHCAVAET